MTNKIYVWDRFVRVFHWLLVALFTVSYLSGDEFETVHVYSGYGVCGLVCLRIIWGLIGSRYARFKSFLFSPKAIIEYAKSYCLGQPKHYLGHNPLGGLMVIALLSMLLLVTLSGMKLLAVEEGEGPFAETNAMHIVSPAYAERGEHREYEDEDDEDFWENVHEVSVNLTIFLIILHLAGVFFSSKVHNEKLVKSMLTGYKKE